jgi:hypothetical protein
MTNTLLHPLHFLPHHPKVDPHLPAPFTRIDPLPRQHAPAPAAPLKGQRTRVVPVGAVVAVDRATVGFGDGDRLASGVVVAPECPVAEADSAVALVERRGGWAWKGDGDAGAVASQL